MTDRVAYGYSAPTEPVEFVNYLRLTAIGKIAKPRLRELEGDNTDIAAAQKALMTTRSVYFADLVDNAGLRHRCEVKLMGRGNPESADAVHARSSQVFVADKLSDLNKHNSMIQTSIG